MPNIPFDRVRGGFISAFKDFCGVFEQVGNSRVLIKRPRVVRRVAVSRPIFFSVWTSFSGKIRLMF